MDSSRHRGLILIKNSDPPLSIRLREDEKGKLEVGASAILKLKFSNTEKMTAHHSHGVGIIQLNTAPRQ